MKADVARLARLDPRAVFSHEALDFTPWLAENLALLGDALHLDLELVGREATVGDFSVDLLARDLSQDRPVVIENQLEATDHSHLGQLITYAAGLDAGVVVWISREFREEHRQALDWLNQSEGSAAEFFGVVVEVLKIDDSRPAVNFRPVAFPNDWTRASRRQRNDGEISGKRAKYQQFFQQLIDRLREDHRFTAARIGQPQNWYSFSSGVRGFVYGMSFAWGGELRAEVYIDLQDGDKNDLAFASLRSEADALHAAFGEELRWEELEGKRACRVAAYTEGSIDDSDDRLEEHLAWAIEKLLKIKDVFGPAIAHAAQAAEGIGDKSRVGE